MPSLSRITVHTFHNQIYYLDYLVLLSHGIIDSIFRENYLKNLFSREYKVAKEIHEFLQVF